MKKTWSQINDILGNKRNNVLPKNMYFGDLKLNSRCDIVKYFNSYFVNV